MLHSGGPVNQTPKEVGTTAGRIDTTEKRLKKLLLIGDVDDEDKAVVGVVRLWHLEGLNKSTR